MERRDPKRGGRVSAENEDKEESQVLEKSLC